MEILKRQNFLNKKSLILGLVLGFFFFLPFVAEANILEQIYYHGLDTTSPSNVSALSVTGAETGPDISNVTSAVNGIYIEGDFRGYGLSESCVDDPSSCSCAVGETHWIEVSQVRIEYKIDNGSWQEIIPSSYNDANPTSFENVCVDPSSQGSFDSVEGTFTTNNIDTSSLPEDGSSHTLTIRSTSIGAAQQQEAFIIYNFNMRGPDPPPPPPPPTFPDMETSGAALANPPNAITGQATAFDFLVENIGDKNMTSSFDVSCKLNGVEFDTGTMAALSIGESDWSWCQHTGIASAGSYTFEVCVDEGDSISESNENNNCDTLNFSVVDPTLPDLDVTSGPSVFSGQLVAGESIKFTATYENISTVTAGASKVNFKINGSQFYSTSLGSMTASQSESRTSSSWIGVEGTHTLETCVDHEGVVSESNESNNCQSTQIIVAAAAGPTDGASITSSSIPTTFSPGETKAISFTVENTGETYWGDGAGYQFRQTDEAGSSFTLNCAVGGTYAHLPFVVHSVSSGHSASSFPSNCDLTAPTIPGVYTFEMQMRHGAGFAWALEPAHNVSGAPASTFFFGDALTQTITVLGPNDDADVTSSSIPTTFLPGETKAISFTVENTGGTFWGDGDAYRFVRTDTDPFVLNCDVGGTYAHLPDVVHSVSSGHSASSFPSNCSLKAPDTPGTYTFSMQMRHSGGYSWALEPSHNLSGTPVNDAFFGEELSQTITVSLPGTINVNATFNGSPWSGSVSYQLLGPTTVNGTDAPSTHASLDTGTWTIPVGSVSGGPLNAVLDSIDVSGSQALADGGTTTFTLSFSGDTYTGSVTGSVVYDVNGNVNHDAGETYIKDPSTSNSGCTDPFTTSGFSIFYAHQGGGPSGTVLPDECSSPPTYSVSGLPAGDYNLDLTIPGDWVYTGPSSGNFTIPDGGANVTDFFVRHSSDVPTPDLTITSGPTPDVPNPISGENVQFTVGFRNAGGLDIPGGTDFIVRFFVDGSSFSSRTVSGLNAGQSTSATSGNWSETPGTYAITACIDDPNPGIVSESSETNNCTVTPLNITVSSPPPAPQCQDTLDNDGDTWIDSADPGCWTDPTDSGTYDPNDDTEANTGQCSDGIDNDGDGFIDGNDPECSGPTDPTEAPVDFEEF